MSTADAAGTPLCPLCNRALWILLVEERSLARPALLPPPTSCRSAARAAVLSLSTAANKINYNTINTITINELINLGRNVREAVLPVLPTCPHLTGLQLKLAKRIELNCPTCPRNTCPLLTGLQLVFLEGELSYLWKYVKLFYMSSQPVLS